MSEIVRQAERIARQAHSGQKRKWGTQPPFITHPQRIAEKVAGLPGMTEVDIAAAWLHDVIEDCGKQWEKEIEEKCGQEVLNLVWELTFPYHVEGGAKNMRREEKNKIRFAHLEQITNRAGRIKLVDRDDNLRDMKNAPKRLIGKYIPESERLVEIIGHTDKDMANEVRVAIEELKKLV